MYNRYTMAKPLSRKMAQKLRSQGKSIKEIAKLVNVSQSTASLWCRDIILSPKQIKLLEKQGKDPNYGNRLLYARKVRNLKKRQIYQLKKKGMKELGRLSKRDLFVSGAALYWAEGFKKDKQVGFANSDPQMIKFFLRWLKVCFGYTEKDISVKVTANISHEYRIQEIERYWSDLTKIPINEFKKPFFQKVIWKKDYDDPTRYFGVLRIRVRKSTSFLRKIHGFIEGFRTQSDFQNKN